VNSPIKKAREKRGDLGWKEREGKGKSVLGRPAGGKKNYDC